MKKLLLSVTLLSSIGFSQIHTTTGAGNFFNPLLWDCLCVPANGDSLVINHAMVMTASIYYTSGQIQINAGGSLMEDASDRDVWIDGGSFINNGSFNCHRLYISSGSFENYGNTGMLDSLWNKGDITNEGDMMIYDFLNDETGNFSNTSLNLSIENNFNNQGYFYNEGITVVNNDFSNCNIQTLDAIFENNGWLCVGQDITNCLDDTLAGIGNYYIGAGSSNFGVLYGSFSFNTTTGALGLNTGTVSPSVSFGTANCDLGVEEKTSSLSIYPNPAENLLYVSESNLNYVISDLSGKQLCTGSTNTSGIDVSHLAAGIYVIQLRNSGGNLTLEKFVKH